MNPLLAGLAAGTVSAREVTGTYLAALHAAHERTGAVAFFDDERARADAAWLDAAFQAGGPVGPLHGLPVTVKDWIDVEGFPCAGETGDRTRRPGRDATVVARLRAAGAVVLAKSTVWGGRNGQPAVRHPVDPARTAGGSSTGEAVVAALGASAVGLGSDSGGSIRLPAAWCGVYGFKPTAGRVPLTGHFPQVAALSEGRTQIGPIAADLHLVEAVLHVIAGPDGHDPGVMPVPLAGSSDVVLPGRRFAVALSAGEHRPQPELLAALDAAAARLEVTGMVRAAWPFDWWDEAWRVTVGYWRREEGSGAEAARQLWDWDRFRRRALEAGAGVDVLLTPVVRQSAPLARQLDGADFWYTLPASLTGWPACSVPVGVDREGLPVAVQVVGQAWHDDVVLAASRLLGEPHTE